MLAHSTARRVDVDIGARNIIAMAKTARAWPAVFEKHGEDYPIIAQDGSPIGSVLPGLGIYLDVDLKKLGITKKLPHVFERSKFLRSLEWSLKHFPNEVWRAAITTYDGIVSARGSGADDQAFSKLSYTTVANTWSSTWQAGGFPAAGTYPAITGAVQTAASTGALSFALASPGSNTKYLLSFGFTAAQQWNMALLHDVLVTAGSISATSTSTQNLGTPPTPALTRYTGAIGVMVTFDITTALGGTASNITMTYTNQAGTGSRSTGAQAMLASGIVQRLTPVALGPFITLQSGDTGVQSITSIILSASMTAGVFAMIQYKPLMFVPGIAANIYAERDSTTQIDGLLQLAKDGSNVLGALSLFVLTNTTSTGLSTGLFKTVAG
jgi:hypothetical protein